MLFGGSRVKLSHWLTLELTFFKMALGLKVFTAIKFHVSYIKRVELEPVQLAAIMLRS